LVLDNIKIPSEKKELLTPFFQHIKAHYGDPVALVHDMGIGILRAIEQVFPGIPDFRDAEKNNHSAIEKA